MADPSGQKAQNGPQRPSVPASAIQLILHETFTIPAMNIKEKIAQEITSLDECLRSLMNIGPVPMLDDKRKAIRNKIASLRELKSELSMLAGSMKNMEKNPGNETYVRAVLKSYDRLIVEPKDEWLEIYSRLELAEGPDFEPVSDLPSSHNLCTKAIGVMRRLLETEYTA